MVNTVSPPWRILLVDDVASARERLTRLLEARGCTVAAAAGPFTAFEMAYNRVFDLAILGGGQQSFNAAALACDLRALGGTWSELPMVALVNGQPAPLRPSGPFDAALPLDTGSTALLACLATLGATREAQDLGRATPAT